MEMNNAFLLSCYPQWVLRLSISGSLKGAHVCWDVGSCREGVWSSTCSVAGIDTCAHKHQHIHTRRTLAAVSGCCKLGFQCGAKRGSLCEVGTYVCVCSPVRLQSLHSSTVNFAYLASSRHLSLPLTHTNTHTHAPSTFSVNPQVHTS